MVCVYEMLIVQFGDVKFVVYVSGLWCVLLLIFVYGYFDLVVVWVLVCVWFVKCYCVIVYDVCGVGVFDVLCCWVDYMFEWFVGDLKVVVDVICGGWLFYFVGYDWGLIQCWEVVIDFVFCGCIVLYMLILGLCFDYVFCVKLWFKQSLKLWYIGFFYLLFVLLLVWWFGGVVLWLCWFQFIECVCVECDFV